MLGPLEVRRDGRLLASGRGRALSILGVLLTRPGRVISADRLITSVWGDDPPATANKALQTHISGLRKMIEPDPSRPALLVTRGSGYMLDVGSSLLDASDFVRLVDAGHDHLRTGAPAKAAVTLGRALGMWRGDAFQGLADCEDIRLEADRLESLRIRAMEELIESHLAAGNDEEAESVAESLLVEDPLRERAWAGLMRALHRMGRQADALRAYRRAREVLGEELGIEPSRELQDLEEAILLRDPRLDAPVEESFTPRLPFPGSLVDTGAIVGRESEIARLGTEFDSSLADGQRLVLLTGEPGIGKTFLAARFCRTAFENGADVVVGRCWEEGGGPYRAVIDVIRQLLAGGLAERRGSSLRGHLQRLVPDLVQDSTPAAIERGTEPYLLREAIAELFLEAAHSRPLVILIEDLQWVDVATIQVLRHFLEHDRRVPVLILATSRSETRSESPIDDLVGSSELVSILPVRGLSPTATRHLAENEANARLTDEVIDFVRSQTGGNPLFVVELVRHLLASDGFADGAGLGLPRTITRSVQVRLQQLPAVAQEAVEIGAVLGETFDLWLVRKLTREDVSFDEATAAGLLAPVPPSSLRFTHDLYRQAIYESMDIGRRSLLHRNIAEVLVEVEAPASLRAYHWREAGVAVEAAEAAADAASEAEDLLGFESALSLVEQALELVDQVPGDHPRLRFRLLESRARLASLTGRFSHAVESAREALDLARRVFDGRDEEVLAARARVRVGLARDLWRSGRTVEAIEGAEAAASLMDRLPDSSVAHVATEAAAVFITAGRLPDALRMAQRGVDAARTIADRRLEASALTSLGVAQGMLGDTDRGIASIREAIDLTGGLGLVGEKARAYNNLGAVLFHAGRLLEAAEALEAASETVSRHSPAQGGLYFRANAASAYHHLGRWNKAWELVGDLSIDDLEGTTAFLVAKAKAECLVEWGRVAEAAGMLKAMLDAAGDDPELSAIAHELSARSARFEGRLERAWDECGEALTLVRSLDDPRLVPFVGLTHVAIGSELRRPGMEILVGEIADACDRAPLPLSTARLRNAEAYLGRVAHGSAPDLWAVAVETWESLSSPVSAAWCMREQAVDMIAEGDAREAGILLRRARVIADEIGAVYLLRRIESASALLTG